MRKLLVVLLVLVVVGVGLGFYLGWFNFKTNRDAETGRPGVELSIDQDKMKSDAQKAKEKVAGAGGQAKDQPKDK